MDPHFYINLYIFHGVFEILSTFLGCPIQNVENGQRPPTQNVEVGRLSLVVLVRKSDFGKVFGLARNPSKKCASTRAFEWYQFRVIWRSWSKAMAKLLKLFLGLILVKMLGRWRAIDVESIFKDWGFHGV